MIADSDCKSDQLFMHLNLPLEHCHREVAISPIKVILQNLRMVKSQFIPWDILSLHHKSVTRIIARRLTNEMSAPKIIQVNRLSGSILMKALRLATLF